VLLTESLEEGNELLFCKHSAKAAIQKSHIWQSEIMQSVMKELLVQALYGAGPKKTMVKKLTLIILDMCREFSLAVVAFKNNLWGAFSLAASFLVSECGIWQEQVYGMAAGYLLFLSPNKWVLDLESLLTLISFDRSLPPLLYTLAKEHSLNYAAYIATLANEECKMQVTRLIN
jgi:hypothetical protein